MQFIDVAGTPTRCVMAGNSDAPAILLLHGLALTAEVWLRNIEALARSHRVIAPDMLGHGFTKPADNAPIDVPAKLRHLKGLVDALGLKRLSLCGSSYGALMASLFFLENEDRVSKLVINGSGSCFNTEEQLQAQVGKLHALYGPDQVTQSTREMWRERIGNNFHDASKVPEELLSIAQLCYAQLWAPSCLAETMAAMQDPERFRPFRILERLEEVSCPALVVWGRNDRGGSLESAEAAVARLPKGRLVVFDDCGHYPMLEHPEKYNNLVAEFLAGA
ncbi:alpha/beta fold hydrolase [Rhodospirillaceae bacterium SYSU D60014]|uniref:alpha/beta fold hydrolase n=1 Tax=Virgifigura deserti TaxID=2268457 RepID=UPI000E66098B